MPLTSARKRSLLVGLAIGIVATVAISLAMAAGGDNASSSDGGITAAGLEPLATVGDVSGRALPDVQVDTFDGRQISLASYRGAPLVVNFFASWCVPCVKEMPDMQRIHDEFGDALGFVGVNVQDTIDDGKGLAERTAVTYDLVRDPRGDLFTEVGGINMPTTLLVGPDGRIVELINGAVDADKLRGKLLDHFPDLA
jgi:thiol-disulfide isomerase/thioredoxin